MNNKRFLTITEAADYLTLGKSKANSFCEAIGAKKKIGKRCVYDRSVIDAYFDGEDCMRIPVESEDN